MGVDKGLCSKFMRTRFLSLSQKPVPEGWEAMSILTKYAPLSSTAFSFAQATPLSLYILLNLRYLR